MATAGPPHHERMLRKSSVPSRAEKPQMGLVSQKNFVTANAIENILAKPKVHDTSERLYILKPDFGEVPAYLQRNREQVQQERQQVQEYILRQTNQVGGLTRVCQSLSLEASGTDRT